MSKIILLEIIRNHLESIPEIMTARIIHSAYSGLVNEMRDCSSAIYDGKGSLVAEGINIPIHLNSLGSCLCQILGSSFKPDDFLPGDIVVTNQPYLDATSLGSNHTKDIIMMSPVFFKGVELLGFVVTLVHHRDVGGTWTGDSWTSEIWQEGILIDPVKLVEGGTMNDSLWKILLSNSRTPREMGGDLMAQISACQEGVKAFQRLATRFGPLVIQQAQDEIITASEKLTRKIIQKIPTGSYSNKIQILEDGSGGGPYTLTLTLHASGKDLVFDFTGTNSQINGPINSPLSATLSAVYYTVTALLNSSIPKNEGCIRPIRVVAPSGTLVNCTKPAGCFQRMITAHAIVELILGALAPVLPERIMAASCGCVYDFCSAINLQTHPVGGEIGHRQMWGEVVPGGLGARYQKDGLSSMACHVTNCPIPSVEIQEIQSPVLFMEKSLVMDSGGAGRTRGGLGQKLVWKNLGEDAQFFHTSQHSRVPPPGIYGGLPGTCSRWIIDEGLPTEECVGNAVGDVTFLDAGKTVTCISSGGGGYGPPPERDEMHLIHDIREGYISSEAAQNIYKIPIVSKDASK